MTRMRRGIALVLLIAPAAAAGQPASEEVTEVRVHGNHSIPDAEIIELAGVRPGDRIAPGTAEAVAERLRGSGWFADVEVRKRYTSLTRTDAVALVMVVRERPGAPRAGPGSRAGAWIRAARAVTRQTFFLPILGYAEGHGVTYGARFAVTEALGERSRIAAPLSLGGRRQAAIEFDKRWNAGLVHVLRGGVAATRVENQHYLVEDRRLAARLGADRRIGTALVASTDAVWSEVRFGGVTERAATYEVRLRLDTRRDAAFPRDAVFAEASWSWLDRERGPAVVSVPRIEARGFLGLLGQSVLAVRAEYRGASSPLPPWAQPLLGGIGAVRGHRVGVRAGDRLAVLSGELRLPVTSPLSFGKIGVRAFFDTGAVFGAGDRIGEAQFLRGAGAGVFLNAALLTLRLDAARNFEGGARLHFATGVRF